MTDDERPSIAELQRIEREDIAPGPWETWNHWTASDRGKVAIRNAAPELLEIAAAALERDAAMKKIEDEKGGVWDDVYRADSRLRAALAKVRP